MWHKRIWDTMKTDQNNNQQVAQQSDKPNFSSSYSINQFSAYFKNIFNF